MATNRPPTQQSKTPYKQWRASAQISQRSAARCLGLSSTYISKVENRSIRPSTSLVEAMGRLYGVDGDEVDAACIDMGKMPRWIRLISIKAKNHYNFQRIKDCLGDAEIEGYRQQSFKRNKYYSLKTEYLDCPVGPCVCFHAWRVGAGMGQTRAANMLGISQSILSEIEAGLIRTSPHLIESMGRLYDVNRLNIEIACLNQGHLPSWAYSLLIDSPEHLDWIRERVLGCDAIPPDKYKEREQSFSDWRCMAKMSRRIAAKKLGISYDHLWRVENQKNRPSLKLIESMGAVYCIDRVDIDLACIKYKLIPGWICKSLANNPELLNELRLMIQ